jgi:hypothetical protein
VHLVMHLLNAWSQQKETWHRVKIKRRLDSAKEKCSHMGPLGVSTGCANFMEDVKVQLVMQLLNAQSQQN